VLVGFLAWTSYASAGLFFYEGDYNRLVYQNWEGLFGSDGVMVDPRTTPTPGMYLAGIFQVNRVIDMDTSDSNIPDTTMWQGVFAQKIKTVVPTATGFDLTFENPDRYSFSGGAGDDFTFTGLQADGSMFAVYADPVAGGTPLLFHGTLASDVGSAQDGSLLASMWLDPLKPNNVGFASVVFPDSGVPFGVATFSTDVKTNNTGFSFADLAAFGVIGEVVVRSRFDGNEDPLSKWGFVSFDPADMRPIPVIPEVSSLWMLGLGVSSLGVFVRRFRV